MEKTIKSFCKNLLEHLDIVPASISVKKDDKDAYQLNLQVSEADTGILIGYHGDTIAALQLILGLMLYQQKKVWTRLILNVGDYRERKIDSLEAMAQDTAEKVAQEQKAIALFNLNPFERRAVHLYLSQNNQVSTYSEGEGKNRHLVVAPIESKTSSNE